MKSGSLQSKRFPVGSLNQIRSMGKRKYILSFVFFVYFLLYSVTPLFSGKVVSSSHDRSIREGYSNNRTAHLYIFDIICSQICEHVFKTHQESPPPTLLLKKKKAVLSEDETERSLKARHSFVTDDETLYSNPSSQFFFKGGKEIVPFKSFRFSSSGLSPPVI